MKDKPINKYIKIGGKKIKIGPNAVPSTKGGSIKELIKAMKKLIRT